MEWWLSVCVQIGRKRRVEEKLLLITMLSAAECCYKVYRAECTTKKAKDHLWRDIKVALCALVGYLQDEICVPKVLFTRSS